VESGHDEAKSLGPRLLRNPITGIAGCCAARRSGTPARRAPEQRDEFAPSIRSPRRNAEQRRWHGEAEHPACLGVDDQLELCSAWTTGKSAGFRPLEDATT